MSDTIIYTSPCIIASEREVIRDGAVVVNSDRVLEVGIKDKIVKAWDSSTVFNCGGILLPPLVNCHTHLELSHLSGISKPDLESGMTGWIEEVLQYRQEHRISQQDLEEAYADGLRQQSSSGVILLADITNSSENTHPQSFEFTEVCQIVEMIAPTTQRTAEELEYINKSSLPLHVSPHSPYSTSAHLIKFLKERAQFHKHIFSVHLAESAAEIELLTSQSGDFRQLLEKRESWDGDLLDNITSDGAVYYLEALGVLDEMTLCVHCVHVNDEEIALLADKQVKVCVCPGSNLFLGVGCVPLEKMIQAGITPGIGTDSIASNESLDMWREMQIIRKQYPSIPAGKILTMATLGGAISLHRENDYGTIEKGKRAIFIEVIRDDINQLNDTDILDKITSEGKPEKLTWITPGNEL